MPPAKIRLCPGVVLSLVKPTMHPPPAVLKVKTALKVSVLVTVEVTLNMPEPFIFNVWLPTVPEPKVHAAALAVSKMILTIPIPDPREINVRPLPALLNVAVSAAPGTVAGVQFAAVPQLVLVLLFYVLVAACAKAALARTQRLSHMPI